MTFFETDIGVVLEFLVYDNGKIADLTGVGSASLFVNGLANPFSLTISSPPTGGKATYTVRQGDFPAGIYSANIKVFRDATHLFTTRTFQMIVRALYGS